MRLQLNLNQYYEGLDISQVNSIFSKFIDMKVDVDAIKKLQSYQEEKKNAVWKAGMMVYKINIQKTAKEINSYMESLGKEKIFDVGESIEDTNFETIISKYEYLMSVPEKEEKNTADGKEHEER